MFLLITLIFTVAMFENMFLTCASLCIYHICWHSMFDRKPPIESKHPTKQNALKCLPLLESQGWVLGEDSDRSSFLGNPWLNTVCQPKSPSACFPSSGDWKAYKTSMKENPHKLCFGEGLPRVNPTNCASCLLLSRIVVRKTRLELKKSA